MELEITIAKDGGLTLHIKGAKGKACLKVTELFEKIVGPKKDTRLTAEYYQPDAHIKSDLRRR